MFAYFRHEDEPTAPEYAQRLTEYLADFTPSRGYGGARAETTLSLR